MLIRSSKDSADMLPPVFVLTADRIYPAQLGISLHDAKLMWLQVLFTDEASEFAHVYVKFYFCFLFD